MQTNVASYGTPSYTYSISAGALPAGTSLYTTTGTVSGTPTTSGPFSYTIEVTDSTTPPHTATHLSSGTGIAPAAETAADADRDAIERRSRSGRPIRRPTSRSGNVAVLHRYIGLPPAQCRTARRSTHQPELSSGTPTTAGAFSYTIKVTDSGSPTAQTATQASKAAPSRRPHSRFLPACRGSEHA